MKVVLTDQPRRFGVGTAEIKDYGKVVLKPWEMFSVQDESGKNCDITATEWGLYLGSSLNSRMKNEGFKVALVKNPDGKIFLNAVASEKIELFSAYIEDQNSKIIQWIDEA